MHRETHTSFSLALAPPYAAPSPNSGANFAALSLSSSRRSAATNFMVWPMTALTRACAMWDGAKVRERVGREGGA